MDPFQELKARLIKRKREIEKELDQSEALGMRVPLANGPASGELSQYDNHPADAGTELYEREKDFVLRRMLAEELHDIHAALERFDKGTYGYDEVTGEKIPLERLQALPTARTVKEHSPNQAKAGGRPVEEEVIENMEKEYASNGADTEYNEQNAYHIVASFNETGMTFDGSSLIDNEDGLGYVEPVEAIGATDIEGYRGDDSVHFLRNIQYDQWMNRGDRSEEDE